MLKDRKMFSNNEKTNNCKLRDLGKVVIVDDKVITKNKHLIATMKKLQDLLDEIDEKQLETFMIRNHST